MPSGRSHYRITEADAISAHTRALQTGGREGISDRNLILSAIGRPYTGYYRPLAKKAAALVESMVNNHGFIDGNKRTTLILTDLLIDKSGYDLVPLGAEDLETAMENLVVSTANGQLRFPQLEEWFKARLRKRNRA